MRKNENVQKKHAFTKGKGKRGRQDGNRKVTLAEDTSTPVQPKFNDIEWYAQNAQLLVDSASFAFATPLGGKYNIAESAYGDDKPHSIPGITSFGTTLVPGISLDAVSPLNIAARNIYSFVRHANSGHSNYDSPDLMLYLLAMDNIYSVHAWLCRLYGTMRFYISTNRYLAQELVYAQGFDFSSMATSMSDLRAFINQIALKLSALSVPNTMAYMKRHRWMFENIYMDAPNVKAQMYLFKPDCFSKYVEMTGTQTYGQLEWASFPSTTLTLAQVKTYVDALVQAIIVSEDLNIMSGDIMKAYGSDNCIQLPYINEDYVVVPSYNMEVLEQIHNIKLFGTVDRAAPNNYSVTQNPTDGTLLCNPEIMNTNGGNLADILFDVGMDSPLPGDVMVASRGSAIAATEVWDVGNSQYLIHLDSCGSEIFSSAAVVSFERVGPLWVSATWRYYTTMLDVNVPNNLQVVTRLSNFDRHPIITLWAEGIAPGTISEYLGPVGDINNFTIMNKSDLRKMHETALLSMFGVPALGVSVR